MSKPRSTNQSNSNGPPAKALIITGFGINCEEETAAAFAIAGAETRTVHLNNLLAGGCDLLEFDILALPGGFSFGDDLGSGKVLANKLRYRRLASGRLLFEELLEYLAQGGFVVGICNGFQALVRLGLLPNLSGSHEQEVTLAANDSGRFEDRWCRVVVNPAQRTPFLAGLDQLDLPVRHGEGKLIVRDPEVREAIRAQGLNCLSYCDSMGEPTDEYPANPNGADLCCAGLTDPTGQILGLMPHPEAYLSLYNHPDWSGRRRRDPDVDQEGEGLKLFRNIVHHVETNR